MAVSAENRFIVNLARKNPMLALVATLLIGISITGGVIAALYNGRITAQDKTIEDLRNDLADRNTKIEQYQFALQKKDSAYTKELFIIQEKANNEVKKFMDGIIEEQKVTIREQRGVERMRTGIFYKSQKANRKSDSILSNIKDEKN